MSVLYSHKDKPLPFKVEEKPDHRIGEVSERDKSKLEYFIVSRFRPNPIFDATPNLVMKCLYYLDHHFHNHLKDTYSDKALQIAIFTIRKKHKLYGMEIIDGKFVRVRK